MKEVDEDTEDTAESVNEGKHRSILQIKLRKVVVLIGKLGQWTMYLVLPSTHPT